MTRKSHSQGMTFRYLLSALAHERVDAAGLAGLPLRQAKRLAGVHPQGIFNCPLGGLRRQLLGVGAPADVADPPRHALLDALGLALTKKVQRKSQPVLRHPTVTATVGQNNNTTTTMYADQAGVGRAHLRVGLVPRGLVPRQEVFVEVVRRRCPRPRRRVLLLFLRTWGSTLHDGRFLRMSFIYYLHHLLDNFFA